jgi:hypothetical protein
MWLSWTKRESVSPVVKEERYFAQITTRRAAALPGDQSSRDGGRSPEVKATWRNRAPSRLSSSVPRRAFELSDLAGGEDYGYFASGAGDAGSNPAAGVCARVAKW